jgi:hypothetical protein
MTCSGQLVEPGYYRVHLDKHYGSVELKASTRRGNAVTPPKRT